MDSTEALNATLAGRYLVEREIGAGGMATVYLARDIRHDRRVALKVLHPDLAAALGAERFLAEIRTTAKLQHPHILPLHDSGEAGGHLFYVMPYVEGETLRARLTRETLLPIDEAVRIAREVLGALDYAHRQGIVHRDVKPENILLHDGSALVADFGIALAVTAAGNQRMTQTGLSLGTPQYMSPEQATGEKGIDGRADIYGMGAVLYEMLVGEPPFSGSSVQAIVAKLLTERPTPPTTVRDTIPPRIEAAVLKALAKLPADRFATAAAFADALGSGAMAGADTAESGYASAAGAHRARTRVAPLMVAGAVGGALLGAGAMMLGRPKQLAAPIERYALGTPNIAFVGNRMTMVYPGSTLTISDDGTHVAWIERDSTGVRTVMVRDAANLAPRQLRGTENADALSLSPDGGAVAFTTINDGTLSVADARGGGVTHLATRAGSPFWSHDNWIYFSATGAAGGAAGVFRVRPAGGSVDTLFFVRNSGPSGGVRDPVPVGSGERLLVINQKSRPKTIALLDSRSGKLTPMLAGTNARWLPTGHILYRSANGALMATRFDEGHPERTEPGTAVGGDALTPSQFDISSNGTIAYVSGAENVDAELRWVGRDGKLLAPLDATQRIAGEYPSLSPDGTQIVFMMNNSLWVRTLSTGGMLKLTIDGGNYPAWAPDGKSISYFKVLSTPGDTIDRLLLKRADGAGQPTIIARDPRDIAESAWSPDGKWLVYRTFTSDSGAGDILGVQIGTGAKPVELVATPAVEAEPVISPNGAWMAYVSDQSGRNEVYVVPFPETRGAQWSVSSSGGIEPRWSRDGKELFYRDGNGNMIAVPITGTKSFAFGTPKVLFSAASFRFYTGHQQYDVSRDGRFIMGVPISGSGRPTLVLMKNWRPGLETKR